MFSFRSSGSPIDLTKKGFKILELKKTEKNRKSLCTFRQIWNQCRTPFNFIFFWQTDSRFSNSQNPERFVKVCLPSTNQWLFPFNLTNFLTEGFEVLLKSRKIYKSLFKFHQCRFLINLTNSKLSNSQKPKKFVKLCSVFEFWQINANLLYNLTIFWRMDSKFSNSQKPEKNRESLFTFR